MTLQDDLATGIVGGWPARTAEAESDELLRLQFRCATLERRLADEAELRATVSTLQAQLAHASGELARVTADRDRITAAVRDAIVANQASLERFESLSLGR